MDKTLDNLIKESIHKSIKKYLIKESTLNKIEEYVNNYDCAILTAWRGNLKDETENTFKPKHISHNPSKRGEKIEGEYMNHNDEFSTEEKKFYNRELKAKLLSKGYGVTNVRGSYKESILPEGQEESFFVVNLNNDENFKENIASLSEYYNQDSFIYSPKDTTEGFLIGTNAADFPGFGEEIPNGKFIKNVQSMFMSRIGNKGFSFTNGRKIEKDDPNNYDNNYEDDEPKTFQMRKQERMGENIIRDLHLETFNKYSINGKRAIMEIAKKVRCKLL